MHLHSICIYLYVCLWYILTNICTCISIVHYKHCRQPKQSAWNTHTYMHTDLCDWVKNNDKPPTNQSSSKSGDNGNCCKNTCLWPKAVIKYTKLLLQTYLCKYVCVFVSSKSFVLVLMKEMRVTFAAHQQLSLL